MISLFGGIWLDSTDLKSVLLKKGIGSSPIIGIFGTQKNSKKKIIKYILFKGNILYNIYW